VAPDAKQAKLSIDTRVLSNFIIELNIARRHFTAYPAGHPLIASSLDKVLLILEQLLEFSSEISLAVARDALMVGYAVLDRKNPVYRDFASTLFEHDIGVVTFRKSLTREELQRRIRAEEPAGERDQLQLLPDNRGRTDSCFRTGWTG
jgi:hypothetical protein